MALLLDLFHTLCLPRNMHERNPVTQRRRVIHEKPISQDMLVQSIQRIRMRGTQHSSTLKNLVLHLSEHREESSEVGKEFM